MTVMNLTLCYFCLCFHHSYQGCSGFVNPLLRYMPIEQYQELSIVFVCLHVSYN